MTSPPNIRAYVDFEFEDKVASCRAKKRRFISNKEKNRRTARTSWASNLSKTEKETEFAPVAEIRFSKLIPSYPEGYFLDIVVGYVV